MARGAEATGVDVAAAMVEIAVRRNPKATFVQAAATDLPFADGSFDAVVGNNVIQHIGEPGQAACELKRILAPGGRIALSSWDAAERSPFFAAVLGAVASAEVPAPTRGARRSLVLPVHGRCGVPRVAGGRRLRGRRRRRYRG